MRPVTLTFLLLPLAACVAPATPIAGGSPGTCRNAALSQFVGQQATQELGGQMLTTTGARVLRWVPMGMMVTMDFRGDRLTVHLDAGNRVTSLSCG